MKRINQPIKVLWGIGDVGFSFMVAVEISFFMFFLTNVAKLPLAMAGTIASLTSVCDMVSALLAGVIIDKCHFRKGKYRPWFLYLPPLVMLFFAFEFTKIGSDFMAATIISIGFIVSHALWNIGWSAERGIVGELTDDPADRAFLSGRISAGQSIGKILASKAVPILILFFAGLFSTNAEINGYTAIAVFASGMMLIGAFVTFFITKGYDIPEENTEEDAADVVIREKISFKDMLRSFFMNRPLICLVASDFIRLTGFYSVMALAAYYCKIVLNNELAVANILLAFNIGTLIGSLVTKSIVKKIGIKMTNILGMGGCVIFMVIAYFLSPNEWAVIITMGIGQIFFGIAYGLTTGMYVNCATYCEYKTGKNTTGFIMGLCSVAIKISNVFKGILIPAGLALVGVVVDAAVTDTVRSGITILFFIVPAAFVAIGIIPLFFYNLPDKEIPEMVKEIASRKTKA